MLAHEILCHSAEDPEPSARESRAEHQVASGRERLSAQGRS